MLYLNTLLISVFQFFSILFRWVLFWVIYKSAVFCWQRWHCSSFHARFQFGCERRRAGSVWGVRCQFYDSSPGGRHQNGGPARARGVVGSRCVIICIIIWTTVVIIVAIVVTIQFESVVCWLILMRQYRTAFLVLPLTVHLWTVIYERS